MFRQKNSKNDDANVGAQGKSVGAFLDNQDGKVADGYNFSVHTMEDDLVAVLNGAISPVSSSDAPSTASEKQDEVKNEGKKETERLHLKSSPFLSPEVASKADSMQDVKKNSASDGNQEVKEVVRSGKQMDFEKKESVPLIKTPAKKESSQGLENGNEKSNKVAMPISLDEEKIHPIEKHLNWKKVAIIIVSLLTALALAGGGYYFFITRAVVSDIQLPEEKQVEEEEDVVDIIPAPSLIYTVEKPNYLNLDMESVDKEVIFQKINEAFANIAVEQEGQPVEFVINDLNNNPIAFSRFAYVFELFFPEIVLSETEENFSIFLIKNADKKKVGLAVDVKDFNVFPFVMKENEGSIIRGLNNLFLGKEDINLAGLSFKDGSYNGVSTRYVNIDSSSGESIDYAVIDNKLLIGTSQETLRSIFDKVNSATVKAEEGSVNVVEPEFPEDFSVNGSPETQDETGSEEVSTNVEN